MKRFAAATLDWFVPPIVRGDVRLRTRHHGIAVALLSIAIMALLVAALYVAMKAQISPGEWLLLGAGIAFPVLGALHVRAFARTEESLVLVNVAGIAIVFGWAMLTGGISSIAMPWLVANLSLICIFGSASVFLLVGTLVLCAQIGLYVLGRSGFVPASIIPTASIDEFALLASATSTAVVVVAAVLLARDRERVKERMRQAVARSELANRAKSTFLSSMSHEFRTPLNAVIGFAEVLRHDPTHPLHAVQDAHVARILTAGEHLGALVTQVLDMSRIEAGDLVVDQLPVDLTVVMDSACAMVELLAQQRGIQLVREPPPSAAVIVRGDGTRLRQVIINFLTNAIKFNLPLGQVTVRILVYPGANGAQQARLEVSDTGPGIAAARQGELFVAFSRLGAESSKVEGSGLGLAISKHLIELMGGRIGLRSPAGEGASFWFELPVIDGSGT